MLAPLFFVQVDTLAESRKNSQPKIVPFSFSLSHVVSVGITTKGREVLDRHVEGNGIDYS
jgi:hypothetical protein